MFIQAEDEYIYAKLDEIFSSNQDYKELNKKILNIEETLERKLGDEDKKLLLSYEKLVIEQLTLAKIICLKSTLKY